MTKNKPVPTPYQRIMRAADKGVGVRLTAEEVGKMAADSVIEMLSANDDERMEHGRE